MPTMVPQWKDKIILKVFTTTSTENIWQVPTDYFPIQHQISFFLAAPKEKITYHILDIQGQAVCTNTAYLSSGIDISNLPSGVYVIIFSDASNHRFTYKFIKTRS